MPAQFGVELVCKLVVESAGQTTIVFDCVGFLLLLTVVWWKIALIVVPPKSIILGIIVVRVCSQKIWSSMLSRSS